MWISQTYLGEIGNNADIFLYYFWEDYARQKDVPKEIEQRLAELGYSFREKVSAYAPMRNYLGHVQSEMEENFREFWWTFQARTPGIFLCRKPLSKFNPVKDEWLFFDIPNGMIENDLAMTALFKEIHKKCIEILNHSYDNNVERKPKAILDTLYESAQLKLTFMGVGIDFKPLLSRFAKKKK